MNLKEPTHMLKRQNRVKRKTIRRLMLAIRTSKIGDEIAMILQHPTLCCMRLVIPLMKRCHLHKKKVFLLLDYQTYTLRQQIVYKRLTCPALQSISQRNIKMKMQFGAAVILTIVAFALAEDDLETAPYTVLKGMHNIFFFWLYSSS